MPTIAELLKPESLDVLRQIKEEKK